MNIEEVRTYCLSKEGAEESFPFGEMDAVIKVSNKIFAIIDLHTIPSAMNLKCHPERAIELREQYKEIQPGYHMNKKHWNTLQLDGNLPEVIIKELIDHSYNLVRKKRVDPPPFQV